MAGQPWDMLSFTLYSGKMFKRSSPVGCRAGCSDKQNCKRLLDASLTENLVVVGSWRLQFNILVLCSKARAVRASCGAKFDDPMR